MTEDAVYREMLDWRENNQGARATVYLAGKLTKHFSGFYVDYCGGTG